MKNLTIALSCLVVMLAGCASLTNGGGEKQGVTRISVKDKMYMTTCSGAVEEWGDCFDRANKTCAGKVEVIKKVQDPVAGKRELTFLCE